MSRTAKKSGCNLSKSLLFVIVICSAAFLWFVYSHWPSSTFSSYSEKLYRTETSAASYDTNNNGHSTTVKASLKEESEIKVAESGSNAENSPGSINVIITFTKAKQNVNLQQKFKVTVNSILRFSSVKLNFYIIGDKDSQSIAEKTIKEVSASHKVNYEIVALDVDKLTHDLHDVVKEMQPHFSSKPGHYYSDALFFLSIAIHRVLPEKIHKVIMLDADLKFNADIKLLYQQFSKFKPSNIMGIARENQPVYRHTFSLYRSKYPGTRVGDPPPNGLTGFNSGVLLLDLDRMKKSELYNSIINNPESVKNLMEKYHFKGHLGDQDLFTLLSMEHEELFYVLPCGWNRQLCKWWEDKGYQQVFQSYFACQGHISIYHGNCDTKIPVLDWETS